ncbi:esterase-like activity of phytase family protein [Pelagerythrobacter rhizovicinus]|uniref:Esterase-like activity of phytase family protein n=1 Tax=Pelagerythrobacter rhizovicinus TaxID=2268576 RepID=A0A4V1QW79_9SPHN|nr:esterase-like activity of phytase family protein [Pelagerythrobacter rhizovicinus]RXZ65216.1 esterase-like activity of phytase family protein [Pelagerythrobacter rhizovicinus]
MRRPTPIRLLAILTIVVFAAPGTWLRTPPVQDLRPILDIAPIEVDQLRIGEFAIEGVWELRSPNSHFGGYSALLALPDGRLLAASDRGRFLRFAPPGATPHAPEFGAIGGDATENKHAVDAEALAGDAESNRIWVAYEGRNSIVRFDPELVEGESVSPPAMEGWSSNSGPEALARLPDGRFLVLQEGRPDLSEQRHEALLFPGDPVEGAAPLEFRYAPPAGYRPVDAASLPDGRVLILHRAVTLGLPYAFATRIAVADPATIRAGEVWRGREIGAIAAPLPADNFEGIAAVPRPDGSMTVWLISDDNTAVLQRTLLYRLRWRP